MIGKRVNKWDIQGMEASKSQIRIREMLSNPDLLNEREVNRHSALTDLQAHHKLQ